ncbi:MAG TPA: S8 family peptidase [Herpetosiphonaceae bacterium]
MAGTAAPLVQAAPAESRVLPQLQREAAASPNQTFRVLVTRINRDPQADNAVTALGGAKSGEVTAETFVATLPGRAIARIGSNPAVKYIAPDALMLKTGAVDGSRLGTGYPQTVRATQLWSGTRPLTGAGVGVAVIDTGIRAGLVDWRSASGASRLVAAVELSSTSDSLADGSGHGTHVAGIIGGNSWYSTNLAVRGKYVGIAPEANLISVKVADDNGMSYLSDVVRGIEWVIANRQTYNIRVMNLSLISSVAESSRTSILAAAVERAWFNGIFVVVASGNSGPNTMQYPPANDPFVVTVGATGPQSTTNPASPVLAPWSSYGTTQDGFSKPDVVAPGRYISSVLASGECSLARSFPQRVVDGTYIWMSGTSMSAPVVAGVAALAFQARPEWTNDQVKWLIQNTSTTFGSAAPGARLVNATAIAGYAGTPGLANQGIAINQQLIGPNGATTYSASSNTISGSTASWSTASWSTASWSTASWSTANSVTASWGTSTEQGVE